MLVLVSYDIPDDRRRTKLATLLEGHGRRVQYSVFECFLSLAEMRTLHDRIRQQVKPEEDNVRLYWMGPEAVGLALTIGSPKPEPPPEYYLL